MDNLLAKKIKANLSAVKKLNVQIKELMDWNFQNGLRLRPVDNTSKSQTCILVDLDGTLAHKNDRSPFDWKRVGEDTLDLGVSHLLKSYHGSEVKIIIMSGRDGSCMTESVDWLERNAPYDEIYMREHGDTRSDWVVKYEMYEKNIANRYNVLFVLDDRNQVVDMWRKIGLPTWQVAEGNF